MYANIANTAFKGVTVGWNTVAKGGQGEAEGYQKEEWATEIREVGKIIAAKALKSNWELLFPLFTARNKWHT